MHSQKDPAADEHKLDELNAERGELLHQLEDWLEVPMLVLGFAWLALLVAEFIWGLSRMLEGIGTAIWIIFLVDFTLKLVLAPKKLAYLKSNWLTVLALILPALRVFRVLRMLRVLRAARASRGLRLVRVVSSLNRGMRALGATMARRGFAYVVALTVVVDLVGAAGMYAFERDFPQGNGFDSYGEALWWTSMIMTTLGSADWRQTTEGRALCFLLALYAFTVFGYVTATLATFFIGRDADNEEAELASEKSIQALHREIRALRAEIRQISPKDLSSNDRDAPN